MREVIVYCEGQTEESFVNNILRPYFAPRGIHIYPVICTTKKLPGKVFAGGVGSYPRFKSELTLLSATYPDALITTMFDYYGLPASYPMREAEFDSVYAKVEAIERAIAEDVALKNVRVNIILHEFEALLFSDPEAFKIFGYESFKQIREVKRKYMNPELINSSVRTAPSKRIYSAVSRYSKVLDGIRLSREIGIDRMLSECPHFREWIEGIGVENPF